MDLAIRYSVERLKLTVNHQNFITNSRSDRDKSAKGSFRIATIDDENLLNREMERKMKQRQ